MGVAYWILCFGFFDVNATKWWSLSCCLPKPIVLFVIKSYKIQKWGKNITKHVRSLASQLTDIKSTLKDRTLSAFFKERIEFKYKLRVDVIKAYSPLNITIGGKRLFSLLIKSIVKDEIIWSVTPLLINNGDATMVWQTQRSTSSTSLSIRRFWCPFPMQYG